MLQVLKANIGEPIRQLLLSPKEKLMAIVTSHTVHIAILPKPDLLNAQHNHEPLKLKTFTIGPTTHVLSQSSIARVLWHPLGEGGNCLVTITTDAVVRLWEFNTENRWSADRPALAIDLKKLMLATSEENDVLPNRSGRNKVFSSDAAGMDVASACFGGAGYGDESPWSAMTLWIAMQGGDIYALCPLLPERWQPPSNLLPSLSTAIVENKASKIIKEERDAFATQQYENQFRWVHDLDSQEPFLVPGESEQEPMIEIYRRPTELSPIARLQGPFQLFSEDFDEILELTDIHVIAAKINDDESNSDSDSISNSEKEDETLSVPLLNLMTKEGRVYVCLDLEGVEAQWLPQNASTQTPPPPDPYLVVLEGLDTLKPGEDCRSEWPTFSQDVVSPYSFFTTHSRGVYYFSFNPWLPSLEKELQSIDKSGMKFRLEIFRNNLSTLRERILSFDHPADADLEPSIPACLTMQDSDLGYFLLTTSNSQPFAAILDQPDLPGAVYDIETSDFLPDITAHVANIPYPPYQPSPAFYAPSSLPNFLDTHVPARHKQITKGEIRLSTATLDIMTEAHRVLSRETHHLGVAAADLFRRCHQLLEVLRNQILKAGEVAERVDQVTGGGVEGLLNGIEGKGRPGQVLEERLKRARVRQERLVERCEKLRKGVKGLRGRDLSGMEKEWVREVDGVGATVLGRKVERREEEEEGEEEEEEEPEGKEETIDDGDRVDKGEEGSEYEEDAEHLRRYREVRCYSQPPLLPFFQKIDPLNYRAKGPTARPRPSRASRRALLRCQHRASTPFENQGDANRAFDLEEEENDGGEEDAGARVRLDLFSFPFIFLTLSFIQIIITYSTKSMFHPTTPNPPSS